ncbi:MAG: RES family NAD+ phosphorylase [Isosphaeraceae bacterium]
MNCFEDEDIQAIVKKRGTILDEGERCDYCRTKGAVVVDATILREIFHRVVAEDYMLLDQRADAPHLDFTDGQPLVQLFEEDYGPVFAEKVREETRQQLLFDILDDGDSSDGGGNDIYSLWCRVEDDPPSRTRRDYWAELESEARNRGHNLLGPTGRFTGGEEAEEAYQVLRQDLEMVPRILPKHSILWRARQGSGHTGKDLAAPPPDKAKAGRGNLQGQPVLYLADERRTAIHEVRPSVGEIVSVAKFQLKKTLRMCDLAPHFETGTPFVESDEAFAAFQKAHARNELRGLLGHALAAPVCPGDEAMDYLATQFLCRMIAVLNFDGVIYASSQYQRSKRLPSGPPRRNDHALNYLLFDPGSAQQEGLAENFKIEAMIYRFSPHALPRRSSTHSGT